MTTLSLSYNLDSIRDLAVRYPEAYRLEVTTVLDLVVRRLEGAVAGRTPKGIGGAAGLAGSIFGEVRTAGEQILGVVGTPSPYGEVIELGRRPGRKMPPIAPLQMWVERKLGVPEDEARSVAFAIARKIAVHGFAGVHMFQKTFDEMSPWIQQILETLPARIVARIGNEQE